jgi:hypothetical protein
MRVRHCSTLRVEHTSLGTRGNAHLADLNPRWSRFRKEARAWSGSLRAAVVQGLDRDIIGAYSLIPLRTHYATCVGVNPLRMVLRGSLTPEATPFGDLYRESLRAILGGFENVSECRQPKPYIFGGAKA